MELLEPGDVGVKGGVVDVARARRIEARRVAPDAVAKVEPAAARVVAGVVEDVAADGR